MKHGNLNFWQGLGGCHTIVMLNIIVYVTFLRLYLPAYV
jgi:hypothetical protein